MDENTMKMALAVVDAAREAMKNSFEAGNDDMDIAVPSHLAAALSLRLDEYDAAPAQQPAPKVVDCHATGVCVQSGLRAEQQGPVAWRETYGKIIKALAEIVTLQTPDKFFGLDAIPRDPVMHLVQKIRAAIDGYTPPQRQPLTDEQVIRGAEAVSEALSAIDMEVSDKDCDATEKEQAIAEYVYLAMQEARHGITKGGAQ